MSYFCSVVILIVNNVYIPLTNDQYYIVFYLLLRTRCTSIQYYTLATLMLIDKHVTLIKFNEHLFDYIIVIHVSFLFKDLKTETSYVDQYFYNICS